MLYRSEVFKNMKMNVSRFILFAKEKSSAFLLFFLLINTFSSLDASLKPLNQPEKPLVSKDATKKVLFNNLPSVASIIYEHYYDPKRIDPERMLLAALQTLSVKISKLVIELPPSLKIKDMESAESKLKVSSENKKSEPSKTTEFEEIDVNFSETPPAVSNDKENKETLVLKLANKSASFKYEPLTSIWGLIFFLKDILNYVEEEIQTQGITEKSKIGIEKIDLKELETLLINAILQTLDPHSSFYDEKRSGDLKMTSEGNFGGVGFILTIAKDGYLTVISPLDNTPAFKAGIKPNDKIIEIAGRSAVGLGIEQAVDLLRGEPGTSVAITIDRNGTKLEINLTRAIIKVESVFYALLDDNIGYLKIKSFQGKTSEDVKNAILDMKKKSKNKLNGLILSLEGNPGGLLSEAVSLASLFIADGEIVSTKGASESSKQVEVAKGKEIDTNLKIVVLVDEGSASASEIIAAALKYRNRAIVIGKTTFGKGSVQLLFNFPSDNNEVKSDKTRFSDLMNKMLKLTIAEYKVNDESIQTYGVTPDIKTNDVYVSKNNIKLFPDISRREVDLDAHLIAENERKEESSFSIDYLASTNEENENEQKLEINKINVNKLKENFTVKFAYNILKQSNSVQRNKLLEEAKKVALKLASEEESKIIAALKKQKINWTVGEDVPGNKKLSYTIVSNKPVKGGDKLKVVLKVKNTGDKTLYRVNGLTHSDTPLFDNREFLFGKVDPLEEIERSLEIEIPKDVVSRKDYFKVELRDYALSKIDELNVPITIEGLKRPRIAHTIFVDSSKLSVSDKSGAHNEVDLVVWLKNVGEGKSFEPTVLLRNEEGDNLFLKSGRQSVKELLPGQTVALHFPFEVRKNNEHPYIDFEVQIIDREIHDVWRDKVRIELGKLLISDKKTNLFVMPKANNTFLYSTLNDEEKVASLKSSAVLNVLKEREKDYLVKVLDDVVGFIKKTDVQPVNDKNLHKKKNDKTSYELVFNRIPAKIDLKLNEGLGFTKENQSKVFVDLSDAAKVSEVLMYVNGKKVLYKDLASNLNNPQYKFFHTVELIPGINNISVFAKEDDYFGEFGHATIYFDNKNIFTQERKKEAISN